MLAVTGANGFVGRTLCTALVREGLPFRPIGRVSAADRFGVGDIGPDTDWSGALAGVSCVVHLAARVHHMREQATDPLPAYRNTNLDGTLRLAREARACGVRRLVFVSTIKVNGERTDIGRPFRADHPAQPLDPYGVSKWEAEQGLWALARSTGLDVVVVRPPLVYGAAVGANFRAMVSLVRTGIPLPFASIRNKRSLIAVENLADLLLRCATHPQAPGNTFLCSDGEDLSTPELLRAVARGLNRPVRLLPAPPGLLTAAAGLVGQSAAVRRLTESLQVEIGATRAKLGWHPPVPLAEAMTRAAAGWGGDLP